MSITIGAARMTGRCRAMNRRRANAGGDPARPAVPGRTREKRGAGGPVRLDLPSKRDGLADVGDGLVAEGDVERLGLMRVRPHERAKAIDAGIVLAAAPDRIHVGCDRDQLGQVGIEIVVVVRRVEQALPVRATVRIVEDREAREMDAAAAAEVDMRARGGGSQSPAADVVADGQQDIAQALFLARSNRREYRQPPWHQAGSLLPGLARAKMPRAGEPDAFRHPPPLHASLSNPRLGRPAARNRARPIAARRAAVRRSVGSRRSPSRAERRLRPVRTRA